MKGHYCDVCLAVRICCPYCPAGVPHYQQKTTAALVVLIRFFERKVKPADASADALADLSFHVERRHETRDQTWKP